MYNLVFTSLFELKLPFCLFKIYRKHNTIFCFRTLYWKCILSTTKILFFSFLLKKFAAIYVADYRCAQVSTRFHFVRVLDFIIMSKIDIIHPDANISLHFPYIIGSNIIRTHNFGRNSHHLINDCFSCVDYDHMFIFDDNNISLFVFKGIKILFSQSRNLFFISELPQGSYVRFVLFYCI